MEATIMEMPGQVFIFDGQTHLDTFRVDLGRRAETVFSMIGALLDYRLRCR